MSLMSVSDSSYSTYFTAYVDGADLHVDGYLSDVVIQNQFTLDGTGNAAGISIETIEYSDLALVDLTSAMMDGTSGADTLTAQAAGSYINGEAGNDTINGAAGNDFLLGNTGNDTIDGGDGNDFIDGGDGNDLLYGGNGDDTISGGAGTDTAIGGAGDDRIVAATVSYATSTGGIIVDLSNNTASDDGLGGQDVLFTNSVIGSAYDDTITGGTGADTLVGGVGNDTLDGGSGVDTVSYAAAAAGVTVDLSSNTAINDGDGGNDVLSNIENVTGSAYGDTLTGDSGANVLMGGASNDILSGGGGNDTLIGNVGNDTLDGGSGNDTVSYATAAAGVTVDLSSGTASNDGDGGNDVLSNIENVTGSAYNDTITGDSGDNVLTGGAGNDTLDGGAGTDTASYAAAAAGITVDLSNGTAGNDGDGGNDVLSNIENVTGSAFNDTITGDSGNNAIDGGSGIDTVSYADASGGVTVNVSTGTATGDGTDTLTGIENVTGSGYADTITGSSGVNTLVGGAGNDTLNGGNGLDNLTGGSGADTFMFDSNAFNNIDVLTDFSTGQSDVVNIAALIPSYDPMTSVLSQFVQFMNDGSGNDLLQVDPTGTATFQTVAQLSGVTGLDAATLVGNGNLVVH